jgi:outer membrane protein assembly factor BamD
MRKGLVIALLLAVSGLSACGKKVQVADSNIVERDRDLYDEAMKFLEKSRFTQARITLQTLLTAYQDSEYSPKAKYAIAESFYMESGSSNLVSAESEYRYFITFFPEDDLADDAQMKIAMTHIRQMQKPDRDDTHARLAEFELLNMINNDAYADSPLLNEAKEKLRGVQEVLAASILGPAKQYFLRKQYPAVVDRCDEIIKKYPDYTEMDRVLFLMGESKNRMNQKAESITYYSQVVRDYPLSDSVEDATERLLELNAPIPEPNALALNRARLQKQQEEAQGKGLLGWLSFGKLGGGGGSKVPTDTGAASIRGGQLSLEPAKP